VGVIDEGIGRHCVSLSGHAQCKAHDGQQAQRTQHHMGKGVQDQ
jgi:hypothetical protein